MQDNGLPDDYFQINRDWDSHPEFHNYDKEIKRLGRAGMLKRGELRFVDIEHDDWCGIYQQGRCDCNPNIVDKKSRQILNSPNARQDVPTAPVTRLGDELRRIRSETPEIWQELSPKVFQGVERFCEYRHPYVHWGRALLLKTTGMDHLRDEIQIAVIDWAEEQKAAQSNNYPFFFLNHNLFQVIRQTDISFIVDWQQMPFPFSAFTIVLPSPNDLNVACVSVWRRQAPFGREILTVTGYEDVFNGKTARLHLDKPHDPNLPMNFTETSVGGDFQSRAEALPGLVFNTLFAMAARPEYIETGHRIGTHKKSKSELWTPNIIGRKYATKTDPNAETGTHASPRMHWRRGHFRQQAFGVGRAEHKILWIEPMLINAKVMDAAA